MAKGFRLEGTRAWVKALREAQDELLPELKPILDTHARLALANALALAPQDEGALKASAYVEGAQVDAAAKLVRAELGFRDPTAAFKEEGVVWGRQSPKRPRFLRRGSAKVRAKFRKALKAAMDEFLRRRLPAQK